MGPLRARPVVDAARASKRHPDGGITSTVIPPHVSTDSIRTATRNASKAVGSDRNGLAHVGTAVDPGGGRRIVLVIIGMITVGSVEHQTTNLMPQRFLISTVQGRGRPIEAGEVWSWWRAASAGCATVLLSTLLSLSESKYLAENTGADRNRH